MEWKPIANLPSASLFGQKFLVWCGYVEIREFVMTPSYIGFDYRREQRVTHWASISPPAQQ